MASSSRVIVIRGDLHSDTGYARATRALAALIAPQARHLVGVSLHEHRSRKQNAVDFPLVSDEELRADVAFRDAFVINICLPDSFIRVTDAVNIGYFFWETDRLPHARFWKADMLKMDRLWAPSRWQADLLRTITGRADIPVVPWPLSARPSVPDADVAALAKIHVHRAMTPGEINAHVLRPAPESSRMPTNHLERFDPVEGNPLPFGPDRSLTYGHIRESPGDLFVAVQTDAPRKGLPLLITNWLRFKASDEGRAAKLVIKLTSIDVSVDRSGLDLFVSLALRTALARSRVVEPDIWFLYDRLSTREMRELLRDADAFVSATLGEGFGGPIAEALIEGTPVIAPRHTSIRDMIDETYPLAVESVPHRLKLWNNIDIYSDASLWHVVDDASFLARLKTFARMPPGERREVAATARDGLLKRAGAARVADVLRREFELCDDLACRGAEPERPVAKSVRQASSVFAPEDATA